MSRSGRPPPCSCATDLVELTTELGAPWLIGQLGRMQLRRSCLRLETLLVEHDRALALPHAATLARISAVTVGCVLVERELDDRARGQDARRDELETWLAVARTKFLMSFKADALLRLDDRLLRSGVPRHQLRSVASRAIHEIAVELLAGFWQRIADHGDKAIAARTTELVTHLEGTLGHLGDSLAPDALSVIEPALLGRDPRVLELFVPRPPEANFVDRLTLATRHRISQAARDQLVVALTSGARNLVDRVLDGYDAAASTVESRLCELLDSTLHGIQVAADFAEAARRDGPDGVARAQHRLGQWSNTLNDIMTRLE